MLLPPPVSTLFPYTTLSDLRRQVVHLPVLRLHALPVGRDRGHHALDLHARVREQPAALRLGARSAPGSLDRKSTRLNSSHTVISYAVFCLKKKKKKK